MFVVAAGLRSATSANAQGMAINALGSAADASAMLDVSSTTQGVLIPRVTSVQRTAISSPATALLVYQTDATAGYYFYNRSAWTSLSGGGSPTGSAGGDLTGTYPNPSLTNTTVTAGTYGSASQVPSYTVNSKGRITVASNVTITGTTPGGSAGGDLTGTYPNPTLATSGVTAGTYGSATQVPAITVDSKGRITAVTNTTISGGGGGSTSFVFVASAFTSVVNNTLYIGLSGTSWLNNFVGVSSLLGTSVVIDNVYVGYYDSGAGSTGTCTFTLQHASLSGSPVTSDIGSYSFSRTGSGTYNGTLSGMPYTTTAGEILAIQFTQPASCTTCRGWVTIKAHLP